ncbi:MAG: ParB family chromosome partitioning protein [Francisellaceae bacterium]|jgi:ParB family chromosome partitioning protein
MSLKLSKVLEKAKEKGYENNIPKGDDTVKITKPWQQESVLYNKGAEPSHTDKILSVDPHTIKNWEFHDRPESELGDIQSLADDFLKVGQQQPCVARPILSDTKFKYELIIGERRWRASICAKVNLDIIVKENMSNIDAALSQAAENDNRLDLSDFAKGMSFSKLINDGVIRQKDLTEKLGRSKQYVSSLLSFSKIPNEIINSVQDWSKVSAKTAEKIKQLSNKGDQYISAIISLSESIRLKKIGYNNLERKISQKLDEKLKSFEINKKVFTEDGRHIFTWRHDNNELPSMHFPKNINNLFSESKINLEQFSNNVKILFEDQLKEISSKPK